MPRLRTTDTEPEDVAPGTRKGRIRSAEPKSSDDSMATDPMNPRGYYDQQLWRDSDFASGYRRI